MQKKDFLKLFKQTSIVFSLSQSFLLLLLFFFTRKYHLVNISATLNLLFLPLITCVLTLIEYFVFKKVFPKNRILIYAFSWLSAFLPNIIPVFTSGFSVFYAAWTFILCSTTTGILMFRDICFLDHKNNLSKEQHKIIYDELRFYLDKLGVAWLTLGSALTLIATILWSVSVDERKMGMIERNVVNIYMVFSYLIVTILISFFVAIPIARRMNASRDELLKK